MSEEHSTSDIPTETTEESEHIETLQIHNVCNISMHDEDESIHDEDESSDEEHVIEIESHAGNGEQTNIHHNKLLTTNIEVKVENQKLKGSYIIQQLNKYSNSRLILEVTKKYGEFILIFNEFTVNGQLMPFYSI